jgi:hypothetical protein
MRKKSLVLLYKFWTYFFQIGEIEAPFFNLLSTAINNFIKQKVNFSSKQITWHRPYAYFPEKR